MEYVRLSGPFIYTWMQMIFFFFSNPNIFVWNDTGKYFLVLEYLE